MFATIMILATVFSQDEPVNELTAEEKASGFELLFDGRSLTSFKGYLSDKVPGTWSASNGEIALRPGDVTRDLATVKKYKDFDLRFEFKISKGGNSGVKILVAENEDEDWPVGPEYQILDDDAYNEGPKHLTGANYAMHAPSKDVHRPAGEWNTGRILKDGNRVEHWLNGSKVVEYELHSDDWKKRWAASKYNELPSYARNDTGYICFQDHESPVWFRSVRIRTL